MRRASLLRKGSRLPTSLSMLWVLVCIWIRYRRAGLVHTVEWLVHPKKRRAIGRRTLVREDAIISWWLVALHVRAICFYGSLAMLGRACRCDWVNSVELVIGVRGKQDGSPEAHAWLLVNDREFRVNPRIWSEFRPILRLRRTVRE